MKPNRLFPLLLLAVAGCAGSGPRTGSTPAPAPAAQTPKPAATPAPNAGFPLTPQEEAEAKKNKEKIEQLSKVLSERALHNDRSSGGEGEIVTDPKTGQKQQRIEKSRMYLASGGLLYLTILGDKVGLPILREDDKAWYVPPPVVKKAKAKGQEDEQAEAALTQRYVPLPAVEAEVVTPRRTGEAIHLTEISDGLPTEGMWRENIAMADLDGDGRPEIVSPAPRLSGREITIFKWDGKSWASPAVTFDDPEKIGFEYGGVACADMDGDGKVDIVYGRHGGGPAIAFNQGGFHFRIETRGLPKLMTTRALAIGDVDGDGHPDVVAVSDEPEYLEVHKAVADGNSAAGLTRADGYVPGIDARSFFWRDGKYVENHDGLEEACFGYSLGLMAPAPDGGDPIFASSCRYNRNTNVIHTFNRVAKRWETFSLDVAEPFSLHVGTAMGIYQGHPASFQTYSKSTPGGGTPSISGYGVSIYYRDGSTWKRKRLVKVVQDVTLSQGIAVGDLNGDGLDDVVFGDDAEGRLRIFLQRKDGEFEEVAKDLEPTYLNHITSMRLADIDGDGRLDIVFAYQPLTSDPTRAGGIRAFRNVK